ncbi:hypothetical protein GTP45_22700 [Pseudoduganella sp. FT55W]|uniref:Uncharacterized protein n=1 Tax=Duganella rivi TaxID=2666083 RepID=A0A7X4GVS6_9BURK|nr:hypothetical protein [Duganella rivi]MYM69632.1 hypothetical protein [Duganella rivi]
MLNAFYAWARLTLDHVPEAINAQLTMAQSAHNPSIRVEFASDNWHASVTCWENCNYHAVITDGVSRQHRYAHHGRLDPAEPLGPQLHSFLAQLGIADYASATQH